MKRGKFSLSNYKLFSCDMGELVPAGVIEVLPGDSIQMSTSVLARVQPLLAPVMHPVHVRIHHWFVPFRLLWDNWEKFITGGPDGMDASVYPTRPATNNAVGSLADYLGYPTGVASVTGSALPFRAYAMIWNEFYRDQDLQTALTISKADGTDSTTSTALQNCCWEKDYFTSARPWEQKGPTVSLPLGTTAPVKGIGFNGTFSDNGAGLTMRESTPLPNRVYAHGQSTNGANLIYVEQDVAGGASAKPLVYADLSTATAASVNSLRQAFALQRFEEARARYGSRYTEYLRALGVRSSDARLQRPEYLGGGKQTLQFSEVLQTAVPNAGSTVVGQMRGHGIAAMRSNRFRRFFEEHGFVMTLISAKPRTMYVQGLPRMYDRLTKTDFWQKELQFIGQQTIKNREVYAAHATPSGTFGYQDRYDEYRRQESTVAGDFRTSTLDFWHMARTFTSDPALNATFVNCVPTERVFPVPAEDVMYIMARHSVQARRLVAQVGKSMTF